MQRQKILKIGIFFCVISFLMSSLAFADGINTAGDMFTTMNTLLSVIILFCSRAWILFAKLAGYFLSNAVIFGEQWGLDGILWNLWNMMKNIANFGLGFLLLWEILKSLIGKAEIFSKDMIQKLIIAGLGIQMSWFLCATLIDISTISLAGISGITTQVLAEGNKNVIQDTFKHSSYYTSLMSENQERTVLSHVVKIGKGKDNLPEITLQKVTTEGDNVTTSENVLDSFLPDREDFSGPLMFIGISLFDLLQLKVSLFQSSEGNVMDFFSDFLGLIFNGTLSLIFYTFTMIILSVVGLLRVFVLQGFIILSPLIILLTQFSFKGSDKVDLGDGWTFSIEAFMSLVFRPVFVCGGLLLAELAFGTLNEAIPTVGEVNFSDLDCLATVENGEYQSTCSVGEMFHIAIKGLQTPFLKVVINLLGVWFMWIILKRSISSLKFEPLKKVAEAGTKLVDKFVETTPFIPTPHGKLSLNNISDLYKDATSTNSGFFYDKTSQWSQDSRDAMDRIFGINRTTANTTALANISQWIQRTDKKLLIPVNFVKQIKDSFPEPHSHKFEEFEGVLTEYFKKTTPQITDWKSVVLKTKSDPSYTTVTTLLNALGANIPDQGTKWETIKEYTINPQEPQ